VIIPPKTYWPEVERICRKYGILMIADEVICGFGRTGKWWGFETMGFNPDIVPMAKGLSSGYQPIGAVAFADAVVKEFFDLGGEFYHGMTYAGHPVAAAVALENIAIIERENLVGRAAELGPYFAAGLKSLNDHPIVGETRSVGLIGAIELCKDKKTRTRFADPGRVGGLCRNHATAAGLIMRACWDTMVISPPLVISKKEIDTLISLARTALDKTYADIKQEVA
jgi:putrescine aminotransferase